MKFNDPRHTLITGLALALSLNASVSTSAADAKKITPQSVKARSALAIAQLPPAPASDLPPASTDITPMPPLDTLPANPLSATPDALPLTTVPTRQLDPNAVPAPAPVPTTPPPPPPPASVAPAPRRPLGMFHGEQERLDQFLNPAKPAPNSKQPPPDAPVAKELDRFGFAPPPGTLGQTYMRRSQLIDEKKHPRVGMVDVYLPEDVDVTSEGLKVKWTGKCWRLESDPLLPGVPHIFVIKAQWNENSAPQYRTIRLIMGRIVDLEW